MVLDSMIAIVVFVLLVVPGVTYEFVTERSGHQEAESGFREATRILLAGLVLSAISATLLVLVGQAIDPLLPDIREWLARPSGPDGYLAASYPVVVRAVAISVALACVLAWLVGLVSTARRRRSGRSARYRPGGTWNTLFDSLVPRDKLPYVSVRLSDGTRLSGYVTKWRTSADGESGQLVVWGPNLSVKPRGGDQIPLDRWDSVVVRLDQVAYVQVAYRGTAQGGRAAEAALGDGSDDDVPEQVPDDARVS